MRNILLISLLILPVSAWGRALKAVKFLDKNQGVIFSATGEIEEGHEVYVYARQPNKKLSLAALLEVKSCDLEECTARVKKMRKGIDLSQNLYYSSVNLRSPRQDKPDSVFFSVGGPLTFGYNLGYFKQINSELRLGAKAGLINAEIGKVGVSGQYVALQGEFQLSKIEKIEFNPYLELGYMKTSLDFKKINGPKFDENSPYLGLGLNVWWPWEDFFLIGKGGYTHNFYKSKYSDATADYSTPFSGGLIIFEVGAGLKF